MYLSVDHVAKHFGDNEVLRDVSFALERGQKIGLVGANGVGKSTLLKIMLGELAPDHGSVTRPPAEEIGYLPQVLAGAANRTLDQLFSDALGGLQQLEARLRELERRMAAGARDDLDDILQAYGTVSEEFERRGGYDWEHRLARIAVGLGIDQLPRGRTMATLSGGEKSRVGLAAILLRAPELLILDEPTNHLDFAALDWLEEYLQSYRGALLVVSHDRQFLNSTVGMIVEIAEQTRTANLYSGTYDDYALRKTQERAQWEEAYAQQQEEIWTLRKFIKGKARQVAHNRAPRDNEKFAYTAKGERVQEAVSRNIHAAEEKLRRLEADPIPRPPKPLTINPEFDPQALVSRAPLTVSMVSKAYGDNVVLDAINFALNPDSRVVIIGPNGAGKSTLLKIIAGQVTPDSGDVTTAGSVVIGYLDQEQEGLDSGQSLFDSYRDGRIGEWEELKVELLAYGLFVWPDLAKPVATLSVGQQRKLQIARLIARRANLLLLDEPTNHVSLDVVEEFERALRDFPGPIIAVAHDRHFIRHFANEIWHLEQGHLRRFLGTWEEWREQQASAAPQIGGETDGEGVAGPSRWKSTERK